MTKTGGTTIYHNPNCSKSREALKLLKESGVDAEVVQYLKTPLKVEELKALAKKLGGRPRELLRTKEDLFKTLSLDVDDDDAVLAAIAKHPVLLERPIVVRGAKAVIGRPTENVLKLL